MKNRETIFNEDLSKLLRITIDKNASDVFLSSNAFFFYKQSNLKKTNLVISKEIIEDFIAKNALLLDKRTEEFGAEFEGRRLRFSVYQESKGPSIVARILPEKIPSADEIGLPAGLMENVLRWQNGLVLVSGTTGSGKTTTLATMIEHINQHDRNHILTIEDPIEFQFSPLESHFSQREVGRDVDSFEAGLKEALRQAPDVMMIGEIRDVESIELALRAAETGALVFASVHARNPVQTISRIVEVFPAEKQPLIRSILSHSLRAIISQQMIRPKPQSDARSIAAISLMYNTPPIANGIRENKPVVINDALQTGQSLGMVTEKHAIELAQSRGADSVSCDQAIKLLESEFSTGVSQ